MTDEQPLCRLAGAGLASALIAVGASATSVSTDRLALASDIESRCNFGAEKPNDFCPGAHPGDRATSRDQLFVGTTETADTLSDATILGLDIYETPFGLITSDAGMQRTGGLAAGDGGMRWGAWVSYTRTFSENTMTELLYDGVTDSAMVGADISPRDGVLIGVAFGVENSDIETSFNAGQQDITGYTVAPYVAVLLGRNVSADISFGYSALDIDQTRIDTVNFTSIITGNTESDRWFVSANLNLNRDFGHWLVSGRVGVLWAEQDIDTINETGGPDAFVTPSRSNEFGQVHVGGELAWTGGPVEPYAGVAYENAFEQEDLSLTPGLPRPDNDDDNVRAELGLRYFGDNGVSLTASWNAVAGRGDFFSHSIAIIGRLAF